MSEDKKADDKTSLPPIKPPTPPETEEKDNKIKRARVLSAFIFNGTVYHPNDVIEGKTKAIDSLGQSVDTTSDAVSYALDVLGSTIKSI